MQSESKEPLIQSKFQTLIRYDGSDNHLINPVIKNGVLEGFPTREDLVRLIDPERVSKIEADIKQGVPILFMPTEVLDQTDKEGNYVLYLFGCVESGDKAHIVLTGHRPSFDVLVSQGMTEIDLHKRLEIVLKNWDTKPERIEDIKAKPFFGYHEELKSFKRLYFKNHFNRLNAMKKIRETTLQMYSDDKSYYYRKVARENNLSLSSWMELRNYKVLKIHEQSISNSSQIPLVGKISDYNSTYILTCDINDAKTYNGPRLQEDHIKKDRTLEIVWDAETYTPHRTGQVPTAEEPNDKFIEICMTVQWKNDPTPLIRICVISEDSIVNPNPNRITVLCNNHEGLIKGLAHVIRALKPDVMGDFNGSDYDWRFYLGKAEYGGLLAYVIGLMSVIPIGSKHSQDIVKLKKQYIYEIPVKINPETKWDVKFPRIPGMICIDACVIYGKMLEFARTDSSRKQSLNTYCKKVGLPGKIDVSIIKMWQTYEAKDSPERRKDLELYVEYCIIDSFRTHQLMLARNVIDENRDVATMAYVSLFDALYFAGGMKVCNLLAAYANRPEFNILMQMQVNENREKGKYPGAWVGIPKKGLHNRRPVTGLDAQSLYPSMIRCYNLSPDKYLGNKNVDGPPDKITNINSVFNGKPVMGAFIRHENDRKKMGLFPVVLGDLFDKRAQMKDELKPLKKRKEQLEKEKKTDDIEYNNICFDIDKLDSKQKATKIYMNTFYGETGNQLSPIYLLQLSCGVTQYGKLTIGFVREFVLREGFEIIYGDTDSVYLVAPDKYYAELDEEYKTGKINKLVYWERMVLLSMKVIASLRDRVNKGLTTFNWTELVKMAYEEVLFPVVFLGKKKYYGIPHEDIVNFLVKKLFIRGIDVIKQGQTDYMKAIGNKIMWDSMNVNNERDLEEITKDAIKWAVKEKKWEVESFVKVKSYKPAKDNKLVKKFVERMKLKHDNEIIANNLAIRDGKPPIEYIYTPPEGGDKFKCIVVNQEETHDLYGKRLPSKIGDMMEYLHVVKMRNLSVNLGYYLNNEVAGMCARFIMYQKKYMSSKEKRAESENKLELATDNDFKKWDEEAQKKAKRSLVEYIKSLGIGCENKSITTRTYKEVYQNVISRLEKNNTMVNYSLYNNENGKLSIDQSLQRIKIYCMTNAEELWKFSSRYVYKSLYSTSTLFDIQPKGFTSTLFDSCSSDIESVLNSYRSNKQKEYDKKNHVYQMLKIYNIIDNKSVARITMYVLNNRESKLSDIISRNLAIALPYTTEYGILFDKNIRTIRKESPDSSNLIYENKLKEIANIPIILELNKNIKDLTMIIFAKLNYTKIYQELTRMKNELESYVPPIAENEKNTLIQKDLNALIS